MRWDRSEAMRWAPTLSWGSNLRLALLGATALTHPALVEVILRVGVRGEKGITLAMRLLRIYDGSRNQGRLRARFGEFPGHAASRIRTLEARGHRRQTQPIVAPHNKRLLLCDKSCTTRQPPP
jgi:hypothetical protein